MERLINDRTYLNGNREYIEQYNGLIDNWMPKVTVVKNGIVLPKSEVYMSKGGVIDELGNFVNESSIVNDGSYIRIDGGYKFDNKLLENNKEKVIYLGYFFKHWGHFLMDCTTRMWILLDDVYKDYKVVFPNHPANICDNNYKRFLELLGVDDDRIVDVIQPTRFDEVLIPNEARNAVSKQHTLFWYKIFDKVVKVAAYDSSTCPEKIYFSRGRFGKPEYGEEEIEQNFRRNGYEIVYPELLPLDEQICLFQNAKEIVSGNSSICMNVVFARKGLKWIVINKYSVPHDNFTELRYSKNIDITYIDAYSDRLNLYGNIIGTMPYIVSFNKNMKQYFDDNGLLYEKYGYIYRVRNIISYIWKCMVWPIRIRVKIFLAKSVRRIKTKTPRIYSSLKNLEQVVFTK